MNVLLLLGASAVMLASPAVAQEEDSEVNRVVVSYRDLDLATAEGARSFDRRLASAARAVCGNPSSIALGERAKIHACVERARSAAMPQRDDAIAVAQARADVAGTQVAQAARAKTPLVLTTLVAQD